MPAGSTMALNFFKASTEAASRFMICLAASPNGLEKKAPAFISGWMALVASPRTIAGLGLVVRVVEEAELHVAAGALDDGLQVDAHLAGAVAGSLGGFGHHLDQPGDLRVGGEEEDVLAAPLPAELPVGLAGRPADGLQELAGGHARRRSAPSAG